MTTRSVVTCPVCAAPHEPGSPRCDYCGSWLLLIPDSAGMDITDDRIIREHVEQLRAALAQHPDDIEALYGLGIAWRNLGLLDDAIPVLVRAANQRPEALTIQRALAGTLYDAVRHQPRDARMWRDVRRQADRVLALDPGAAEGWRLKAEAALRTGDDTALIALAPELAAHDPDGDYREVARRLQALGDRYFHDWQWDAAVDAWQALAAHDPAAGRTALAGFLLQNTRLVPRPAGPVWRALRLTMARRGDFGQSTLAALALGIAVWITISVIGVWLVGSGYTPVFIFGGLIVWPALTVLLVRTWLVGWPPFARSAWPWTDVPTGEMVRVARGIAPLIVQVRPDR